MCMKRGIEREGTIRKFRIVPQELDVPGPASVSKRAFVFIVFAVQH